jgi:hypothetical protein
MDKRPNNQATNKNDLSALLFLLIIFSMFLSLRISSLRDFLNGSNSIFISGSTGAFDLLIVPIFMGIALLVAVFVTKEKALRKIYIFSIMPFIIDTKLLYFLNQSLVAVANVLVTFVIIIILFLHIAKYYRRDEGRGRAALSN